MILNRKKKLVSFIIETSITFSILLCSILPYTSDIFHFYLKKCLFSTFHHKIVKLLQKYKTKFQPYPILIALYIKRLMNHLLIHQSYFCMQVFNIFNTDIPIWQQS